MECSRGSGSTRYRRAAPALYSIWALGLLLCCATAAHAQAEGNDSAANTAAPATDAAAPAEVSVSGARELLELYGVGPERLEQLTDGTPLQGAEQDVLLRLLTAIGRFDLLEIYQWTATDRSWREAVGEPAPHRGEIYMIAGRVRKVEAVAAPPELAARFDIDEYFRCEVMLEDESQEEPAPPPAAAIVYAERVPDAWPRGEALDERISGRAFFVKLAGSEPEPPTPVFAITRLAWHPQTVLGDLGMDVGLLDDVTHQTAVIGQERETFYQMLAACKRAGTNELLRRTNRRYSVVPLFNDADSMKGELVALTGTARRAVKVRVEAADINERFGIDHYYEVTLFTEDSQNNPITFCVLQLPPGMKQGDRIHEPVRVAGFFFKTWGYLRQPLPGEEDTPDTARRQLAPLLMGRQPVLLKQDQAESPWLGLTLSILFVLAILGMWLMVWRFNRSDKDFTRRVIEPRFAPEGGASLDELGIQAAGPPSPGDAMARADDTTSPASTEPPAAPTGDGNPAPADNSPSDPPT